MARPRNPKRDEAFQMWLESKGQVLLKDIAEQLDLSDSQIRKWKNQDKWDDQLKGNVTKSNGNVTKRSRGAPSGNSNAKGHGAPKQNQNATTHGFFAKFLPEETLEIMETMNERSPADLIWDQIIQYAAIIRAQRIMHVESKDEIIKELKKAKYEYYPRSKEDDGGVEKAVTEEEYEFQFAWERQAQLLTAQSRAIGELRSSIRQFVEMADQDDERRLKLEQMQLSVDKTKTEISKLKNPDSNKQESEIAKMLRRMAGDE
ncbi:phage terminase small subunit [Lysinibacillus capsici]|uniref:phage terminase small subunit n=1 Tax=Lysinibacillus capsici TaxID=2115968 RepID=UPI00289B23C4|nr:phage terminase small subunit [Lysinibacillus capsici]